MASDDNNDTTTEKPNFIDSNAQEIERYMKDKYDDPDRYVH